MITIDALGEFCPVPIILLNDAARDAEPGTEFEVLSDDEAAAVDVPAWCRMKEHTYLGREPHPPGFAYRVRLGQ